jgi:hypothetical protein
MNQKRDLTAPEATDDSIKAKRCILEFRTRASSAGGNQAYGSLAKPNGNPWPYPAKGDQYFPARANPY